VVRKFRNQTQIVVLILTAAATCAFADSVPGEYVVKFKNSPLTNTVTKRLAIRTRLNAVVKKELPLIGAQVVISANGKGLDESYAKELLSSGAVEYVEPNYIYKTSAVSNDPKLSEQWGFHNYGQQSGTTGIDINVSEAWDQFTGDTNSVVGVVDTGVSYLHEDLQANMWTNPGEIPANGIDDDNNGVIDDIYGYNALANNGNPLDDNGHGTHCAGVIAAVGNNGIGVVGVNWKAKVMALKFLDDKGSGTLDNAVEAIEYAVNAKRAGVNIRVLSNSWGGEEDSQALSDAIKTANDEGILFVAAAGNASNDNDAIPTYPANINQPNLVSVAAVDRDGNIADFSNYGSTTVDIAAPGVSIESTWLNGTYKVLSGTSMAAPHVAGVATLLINREPNLTVAELKARLTQTVKPLDSLEGSIRTAGMLNAGNALLNRLTPIPPPEKLAGYVKSNSVLFDNSGLGDQILSVDDGYVEITLPFTYNFYDRRYTRLAVSANGRIIPLGASDPVPTVADFSNRPLPGISVYHDDYVPGLSGGVYLKSDANSATFTWNVTPFAFRNSTDAASAVSFQLKIYQSGVLEFKYLDTSTGLATYDSGASATVSIVPLLGVKGERLTISNNTTDSELASGKGLSFTPKRFQTRSDIDGDGISDPVFFNQTNGGFRALLSSSNYTSPRTVKLGQKKDKPFICDLDGDKRTDLLVYRSSEQKWYYQTSKKSYSKAKSLIWGGKSVTPIVGDFDGDGKCDLGYIDPKKKRANILLSSGGLNVKNAAKGKKGSSAIIKGVGKVSDLLVGDFNGDGKESLATVSSVVSLNSAKTNSNQYLSCDLNSDGKSENIGVSLLNGALYWSGGSLSQELQYGRTGDKPACANDYDGDGAGDISVYRPATSELFIRKSSDASELKFTPAQSERLVL
jgi:thermitase